MCEIPKEGMMACQLAFYPLGTQACREDIERVLQIIRGSGLTHTVGEMSTLVQAPAPALFALLQRIAETMDARRCAFSMSLTLSNTCGVE